MPGRKKSIFKERKKINYKLILVTMIFAVVCVLLLAYGISAIVSKKDEKYKEGIEKYNAGSYIEAEQLFSEALLENQLFSGKKDANIRLYLADSYLRSAQYDLAAETYDEIIESGKNVGSNVEDLMKLSKSLNDFANGNYGGALDELLEQAETYPELYMYIGTCYAVTKDEDKMFESYEKYVTAYGFNSYVYAMYSSYYLEQDDLQTAIAYINNGLSCDDTVYRKELLMLEVTYYEKSGDFHEAYEKTVSILSEYPDYETAQNELKFLETRDTDN